MMRTRTRLSMCALLMLGAGAAIGRASDRVAVYAKVDRVVFEPGADAPERIQVWGVFSIAQPNNPNDYRPPAGGYLYFKQPGSRDAARREWADLKAVAGTGQFVAFGSRWDSAPRLRQANETPASPDVYGINIGVSKVQGRTDYAPIRALLEYKGTGAAR